MARTVERARKPFNCKLVIIFKNNENFIIFFVVFFTDQNKNKKTRESQPG
jgi:hypothetical protein